MTEMTPDEFIDAYAKDPTPYLSGRRTPRGYLVTLVLNGQPALVFNDDLEPAEVRAAIKAGFLEAFPSHARACMEDPVHFFGTADVDLSQGVLRQPTVAECKAWHKAFAEPAEDTEGLMWLSPHVERNRKAALRANFRNNRAAFYQERDRGNAN